MCVSQGEELTVFITWSQCLISLLTIVGVTAFRRIFVSHVAWLNVPLSSFMHTDILALSFSFIGVIVTNNLLLKHIGVAFYQVARSSTLIFTVLLSRLIMKVPITYHVAISCLLTVAGFMVTVDQEMIISSLSWKGILYGILASIFAAFSGICVKRAGWLLRDSSIDISLTMNANSFVLLFPLLIGTGQLKFGLKSYQFASWDMCWCLILSGILSLLVGWASNKVISLTSPLTHNMSINGKSLLQTVIAVLVRGESKTNIWWLGNVLVTCGLLTYGFSVSQAHLQEATVEIIIDRNSPRGELDSISGVETENSVHIRH